MQIIQFYKKIVYGKPLIYLIESSEARDVLTLIGTKTITEYQIGLFTALGIEFERVFEPTE